MRVLILKLNMAGCIHVLHTFYHIVKRVLQLSTWLRTRTLLFVYILGMVEYQRSRYCQRKELHPCLCIVC